MTTPPSTRRRWPTRRGPSVPKSRSSSVLGLIPLVLLAGVWQLLGDPDSALFPPPSSWWEGWTTLVDAGAIGGATKATVTIFLVSLAVSIVLGTAIGAVVGTSRRAERATAPLLHFLMCVPPPTIVPVAILLAGIGPSVKVGTVVFAAVWPILLNTAACMRAVPPVRLEAARLLGLSRRQKVVKLYLPSLVPGIALGAMIAAPICIIVTLLSEMLTSTEGLGFLLLESQRAFQAEQVFALLVAVGALGYLLNTVVVKFEQLLTRNWPISAKR